MEPQFKIKSNSDLHEINLELIVDDSFMAGRMSIRENFHFETISRYWTSEAAREFFQSDWTLILHSLYVDTLFRREGIANQLMQKLDQILNEKYSVYNNIILYAKPSEQKLTDKIPLATLKEFYEKYGFKEIPEQFIDNRDSSYENNFMIKFF